MNTDPNALRSLLEADPTFTPGSAYVRTKILCRELTKLGRPIPTWETIRHLIDKGSATDISRAVKDYRREHGELLRRIEALPQELPESLAAPMIGLWRAALAEAEARFNERREELDARVTQAEAAADEAQQASHRLAVELSSATERAQALVLALDAERQHLNAERAARAQAERMAEKHIADLTQQRDDMTKAVEANTTELRTLTARLEDERRRSLMQIEQARQQVELARQQAYRESEQKMAKMEAQLRGELASQNLEYFRLQKHCGDLESRNAKLSELVKKDARPAPAVAAKRKPALKAAPGRVRRLKGKNHPPAR